MIEIKEGWKCLDTKHYARGMGQYTTYLVTSPSGNTYHLHNYCDKYPSFSMETDRKGYYDKPVGETFEQAMEYLYELEEWRKVDNAIQMSFDAFKMQYGTQGIAITTVENDEKDR
jgi:hypothetical protein